MKKVITLGVLAGSLLAISGVTLAAEEVKEQVRNRTQTETQPVLGRQIMTPEEKAQQRTKMRNATSTEEREKVRSEHHEEMKARAKEQGVTLPDEPPMQGQGGMRGGGMGGGGRGGR
jgi:hypothetical protein